MEHNGKNKHGFSFLSKDDVGVREEYTIWISILFFLAFLPLKRNNNINNNNRKKYVIQNFLLFVWFWYFSSNFSSPVSVPFFIFFTLCFYAFIFCCAISSLIRPLLWACVCLYWCVIFVDETENENHGKMFEGEIGLLGNFWLWKLKRSQNKYDFLWCYFSFEWKSTSELVGIGIGIVWIRQKWIEGHCSRKPGEIVFLKFNAIALGWKSQKNLASKW